MKKPRLVRVLRSALLLIVVLAAAAEFAARVYGYFFVSPDRAFSLVNFADEMNIDKLHGSIYPARYDPLLGHVAKPGVHAGRSGTTVTINVDGIRSNAVTGQLPSRPIILAAGDSFTYGDQVNDRDTWPAQLESSLGLRTVNAGVFGYGLGQITLMAERQVARLMPDLLIVGIIPDDIDRAELAVRTGIAKPTFFPAADGLRLVTAEQNQPEVARYRHLEKISVVLRAVFGHSFLVHNAMFRLAPEYWLSKRLSVRAHSEGVAVGCRLLARLGKLPVAHKVLLVQYPAQDIILGRRPASAEAVLDCVGRVEFKIVDTFAPLRATYEKSIGAFSDLYVGHMSPAGNRLVAGLLADVVNALPGWPGGAATR
jgi:hypothetical protein